MLWNRRVLQTRLSHFRSCNLAPPLLHHHGLQNPSIPAGSIHHPFGKRHGLARHSSSKVVNPSEGDNAIGKGKRLHIAKSMENDPEDVKPYGDKDLRGDRADMTAQSALVTRYVTCAWPGDHKYGYRDNEKDWVLYSIVVQSPLLRRVLESRLGYYSRDDPSCGRINISSEHVEIRASSLPDLKKVLDDEVPFNPFLKERLEDALRKEQDPETKEKSLRIMQCFGRKLTKH